jgi:hypothetical protein
MADRKALIGEVLDGVVLHEQDQWTPGSDRLADPEGRVLALLTEIPAEGGGSGGSIPATRTIHVDPDRTDTYTADGSVSLPYKTAQAGIDALMALTAVSSEVNGVLRLAPSRAYVTETSQLVMTLPTDASAARRLAIVGDSVSASNTVILPPLRIDAPGNGSVNFIAMRGLCFAGVTGGAAQVLHVQGHASFTGQIRMYLSDMQFHTNSKATDAFYVDAVGGGSFGLFGVGHTNFVVHSSGTGNAIRMERGWMNLRGANVWGGSAAAINLSGSASVTLWSGELTVAGGTDTNLVTLAGTAGLHLNTVYANPRGNGHIVTHSGTGVISLRDVNTGQLPGGGTGGIDAAAGATVLLGVVTKADGSPVPVTVASSALLGRVVPSAQVGYVNAASGLTAVTAQAAIDELAADLSAQAADGVSFDNTTSGLTATDVQAAIDELKGQIAALPAFEVVAGAGLAADGSTWSVAVDDTTIEINGSGLVALKAYVDGSSDGASGSAWATSAPASLKAAIDRLATQLAAHLGGTIPA